MTKKLMQGNEACIMGAIRAGLRFYAGYPITPSTEIAELASEEMPKLGGVYLQMEDEIASISAVIGAGYAGSTGMTATSGPGFSLMQEMLGYAVMAEIPAVIALVMRVGPSTGLATAPSQGDVMQSRWGTHGPHPAICLCPSSVEEIYELTIRSFSLANKYRMPVTLLFDAMLGHMKASVEVERADGDAAAAQAEAAAALHVTGLIHDDKGFPSSNRAVTARLIERLMRKADEASDDLPPSEALLCEDAEYLVVAYGSVAGVAKQAVKKLRDEGERVGLFIPKVLWPFRDTEFTLAEVPGIKRIIVAELNDGQYAGELRAHLRNHRCTDVKSCCKMNGEQFQPGELYTMIKKEIGK